MRTLDWIVRGVLARNFALFIALFIPAYSGIGQRDPGCSERRIRVGVRINRVHNRRLNPLQTKERHYHETAILCLVWLVCFLVYLAYSLVNSF